MCCARKVAWQFERHPSIIIGNAVNANFAEILNQEVVCVYELPDHELEVLEEDETVPPRPEETIADADRGGSRDT